MSAKSSQTEVAIREVYKYLKETYNPSRFITIDFDDDTNEPMIRIVCRHSMCLIPLKDCFNKRQPLTGIEKDVRKLVRSRKSKRKSKAK